MSTVDPFFDDEHADADPLLPEPLEPSDPLVWSADFRMRPPPRGMPRADRRQWRKLEVARVQRASAEAARAATEARTGWRQVVIERPPRGIGRRGRSAWLHAQRESTRRTWRSHRDSSADLPDRALGVLVIAAVLGIGLVLLVMLTGNDEPTTPSQSATPSITLASPSTTVSAQTSTTARPTSTETPPPESASLAGRWDPVPDLGVSAVSLAPMTPINVSTVITTAAPTDPPSAEDQQTPVAVVRAWLTRTCSSTFTEAYGTNVERGRALMTTAGWRSVDPAEDSSGAAAWARAVDSQQTRSCGEFTVQLSAGAPPDGGSAFVGYRGVRVVTAPDHEPVPEPISGTRLVRQASDGRWFVDIASVGG